MPSPSTKPASSPPPAAPSFDPTNPFIVQSDRSILVEVDNPKYAAARDALAPFAELEKSPEHIHTYRVSNLSLWNAAAAGITAEDMLGVLAMYTKFPIPANIPADITETVSRYGRVKLERVDDTLMRLVCRDKPLLEELSRQKKLQEYLGERLDGLSFAIQPRHRGVLKQGLIAVGYPAEDLAGYTEGADLPVQLREVATTGLPFHVRDYQKDAAAVFHAGGDVRGGSGVIVLPCGAGKTIVGVCAMALLQKSTLVLTTSVTAVKQWIREIIDKSTLTAEDVKEYTGELKEIGNVTVATYQIITYRPGKKRKKKGGNDDEELPDDEAADIVEEEMEEEETSRRGPGSPEDYPHFKLFEQRDWGLIIYDEVHLLPAPVFRVTAQIQARRRLGLTATLIREDQREGDVFTLIGPKKYDVPWRELETKGWIASASCSEIRVGLPDDKARMEYAVAEWRQKYRLASENPLKDEIVAKLLEQYADQRVIVIGQYLSQLKNISKRFDLPLITGSTPNAERELLYNQFRRGEVRHLVLSKVGNFAIDLPDANVLIQISGTFGSRQEEAQRLGRVLRPKGDGSDAHFYTVITRDTKELDFAQHRQMFLTEQGYSYEILDERRFLPAPPPVETT
ncbi:helicase-associated domain-containing protein [Limnoglobus roseus]|uniref:DNA 3'-5' helicase n=1 Tax=Limnoglobus roseus TaxID=2598579 RepID=A0A5C1AE65_9BACT|nr:helicase-associated domain-containing protein [Limnoglobus roseus]QEL16487.1 helicase [Limnoglobus roseus]